ncbi:MAG: tetratricopeptide repeat protein, partial [Vicinamibacterales bacterium]
YEFFADDAMTLLRWLVVNPWLIVPLGIVGLALVPTRDRRADFVVWVSFVPAYAAAVAAFFVAERYRVPLFVPLCVGTGALVDRAVDAIRARDTWSRRWLAGAAASAAILFALVSWPLPQSDSREGDRVRMASRAAEAGRFDEAERWAGLAEQASTSPVGVEAAVGHALVAANQPARALGYLERAQARGSRDPLLLIDLATAKKELGDTAAAIAVLRTLDIPAGAEVHLRLQAGRLAAMLGATDLAEQHFRQAVRERPDLADAWAQLGFDLLVRNDVTEAAKALTEAVRLNPRDPVALGGLAVCESRLGKTDDAIAHARAALAIDPKEALSAQVLAALVKK